MIKVLIERKVVSGLEAPYEQAIADLMDTIGKAPGYMGGESFHAQDRKNHYVVVSNWANISAWRTWFHSRERQMLLDRMNPFLEYPEKCTVLKKHLYRHEKA